MTGNPFSNFFSDNLSVPPCIVVIFGATGDLTHRKLVPALYNLGVDGLLPTSFDLIGVSRADLTDEAYRENLKKSVGNFSRRKPLDEVQFAEFSKHVFYSQLAFDDPQGYENLKKRIEELDKQANLKHNCIFYFATAPNFFDVIAQNLKAHGLLDQTFSSRRVIVEKPFGTDLLSAQKLNRDLLECMKEEQIFRIDHYLGKETVQNILVFRFTNGIFEPIWNYKYISHIEICVSETIGVENRAGYFDQAGVLRDIVQNHALQLLSLVALEPPVSFEANSVRDEKVKVLKSLRRIPETEVSNRIVRGRYQQGYINGEEVKGYLAEPGVSQDSVTDTYVAMELYLDSWRWAGVPFFLRAGKRLAKRVTDISIHFRNVPFALFREPSLGSGATSNSITDPKSISQNVLSFRIQPNEGISLKINSKPPGPKVTVKDVNMEFSYGTSFGRVTPEAYERLLLDCMKGDATLFARNDEIEQAWDCLTNVFNAWRNPVGKNSPVYGYEAGSWGPKAAEDLINRRIGLSWRRL